MDTNDYYTLLAPAFLSLMFIEMLIGRVRGERYYVLPDTLANLSCGLGQILLGIFTGALILTLYAWFHQTFALVKWSEGSVVPWIMALIGVDFCYYWFHRASHQVHLLWAIHVVHHQSEEMNISVALRQTWFSDASALLFFWPLPLLGVPIEPFFVAVGVLSLYEASLHTRLTQRSGVWGWIFNTPAHHRLHHGKDTPYLDRNFASSMIIWDRLFGTFVRKTVEPHYGTLEPLRSYNPLWAQLQPVLHLVGKARACAHWRDRLGVVFMPPHWTPPSLPVDWYSPPPERVLRSHPVLDAYALMHAIIIAGTAFVLLGFEHKVGVGESALFASLIIWGTGALGGVLEGRAWAMPLEIGRLALLTAISGYIAQRYDAGWVVWMGMGFSTLSLGLLVYLRGVQSELVGQSA